MGPHLEPWEEHSLISVLQMRERSRVATKLARGHSAGKKQKQAVVSSPKPHDVSLRLQVLVYENIQLIKE